MECVLKHKHYQPCSQLPRDRDTISECQNVKSKPYKNRIIGLYIHRLSLERNGITSRTAAEAEKAWEEGQQGALPLLTWRQLSSADPGAIFQSRCFHVIYTGMNDPIICRLFIIYLISSGLRVSMKKEAGVGVSDMWTI